MDVTVIPEEGNFPAVAKALLEAADHPGQVRMVTWPQSGFQVPEEVFERFEAAREPESQEPRRRKPGRPRKAAEKPAPASPGEPEQDSDNDDASEEE